MYMLIISMILFLFPLQYFYKEYCLKTRDYLNEFDTEFDEKLGAENERQKKVCTVVLACMYTCLELYNLKVLSILFKL